MAYSQSGNMATVFKLPLVPGMTCGDDMLRRNYHKGQVHGERWDGATTIADTLPDMAAQTNGGGASGYFQGSGSAKKGVAAGSPTGADLISDKDLAGRVLRFYAYTWEVVPESAAERERVRQYILYYYLEDNTLALAEPRIDNSGFAFGGTVLRRHIVPLSDGTPITFDQLRVGETVTFYGQTYMIYDADDFTRTFFESAGSPQAPAQSAPTDNYTTERQRPPANARTVVSLSQTNPTTGTLTASQVRATQQFLANDRKVLRCDCVWDDSEALFGQRHYLTLYYFLSDGSMAVVEKSEQNSGRDPFPTFFRRQRIAKPVDPSGKFDAESLGSLTFKDVSGAECYTSADIRIGNVLNLYGRKVKIYDYNAFTRQYLEQTHGIKDHTPLPGCLPPPPKPAGSSNKAEKPAEGKVNVEDSSHVANSADDKVVKFLMKLSTTDVDNAKRRFALVCHVTDGTIAIFETAQRNSGVPGGKFLQRQRIRREDGSYFSVSDFSVGAKVKLNGYSFELLETDEHSKRVMEETASANSAKPTSRTGASKVAADKRNPAAAQGARIMLGLYEDRRQLFNAELRFITDYAADCLIGAPEFQKCIREKLKITEAAFPEENLVALCTSLFPPSLPRLPFEEFYRLLNNTSTLDHNVSQIAASA